ncbi:hypothetical protein F2Q69_00035155 [Brassica cretica]|uniref:Uncharacterized protein n=1 Tax=Brassica cretica TaxID=69181 RepID=A0A8S9SU39_BRACR|nr:hypothetical protein F2Q69_00035155 [Brassica cretica]
MLIASVPSSFLFISSEVLTCEIDVILKTLVEEEELMNLLFSFLEPNRSHSVMLAGYFSKVVICLMLSVGVKNGHDEVNIQISVKINMNIFTKSILRKITFTKSLAVKYYVNLGSFIETKEHVHETTEKDANKVAM